MEKIFSNKVPEHFILSDITYSCLTPPQTAKCRLHYFVNNFLQEQNSLLKFLEVLYNI